MFKILHLFRIEVFPLRSFSKHVKHNLKRHSRDRMRWMMRGYRRLKSQNRLSFIEDLNKSLREQSLAIPATQYSPLIFGAALPHAERVVRQALVRRQHYVTRALLVALGGGHSMFSLPMPKEWQDVIESAGFRISRVICSTRLLIVSFWMLMKGLTLIAANLIAGYRSQCDDSIDLKPYVYFCGLRDTNLPQPIGNSKSFCVVNWYCQWNQKRADIKAIYHGVETYKGAVVDELPLLFRKSPIPNLPSLRAYAAYLLWALQALLISAADLIRGRWWHALLLPEASNSALARLVDYRLLARQYFFHNSFFYPPMWTYELKRAGSEALFYFYSTNSEPFKRQDGTRPFTTRYSIMNWQHYLVWNEFQADFVRKCEGNDYKIEVVGPIWFEDSDRELKETARPTIALFDVQPQRSSAYCLLTPSVEYYVPVVANKFLSDVICAASVVGACVLWKRKRNIGRLVHPSFRRHIEILSEKNEVYIIDPTISAIRVIEKADVVISMPFTSTALIAQSMGKPSIYYDAADLIQSGDDAAHGVPLVCGLSGLERWLREQMQEKSLLSSVDSFVENLEH